MTIYGPQWPLKRGTEDTFARYEQAKDQINFYLKCLLLTSKGENLSDPGYGVGLRSFLFEQNIGQASGQIQSEIELQIRNYLPYLRVASIDVNSSPDDIDNGVLNVRIEYSLPGRSTTDIFELESENSTTTGFY